MCSHRGWPKRTEQRPLREKHNKDHQDQMYDKKGGFMCLVDLSLQLSLTLRRSRIVSLDCSLKEREQGWQTLRLLLLTMELEWLRWAGKKSNGAHSFIALVIDFHGACNAIVSFVYRLRRTGRIQRTWRSNSCLPQHHWSAEACWHQLSNSKKPWN